LRPFTTPVCIKLNNRLPGAVVVKSEIQTEGLFRKSASFVSRSSNTRIGRHFLVLARYRRLLSSVALSEFPNGPLCGKSGAVSNFIQTRARDSVQALASKGRRFVQEDCRMWLYVQTWLPLLTIGLTAAICFSVAAFIMGQPQRR
jgi:hypothetical protein